jgi:hypothetical protein
MAIHRPGRAAEVAVREERTSVAVSEPVEDTAPRSVQSRSRTTANMMIEQAISG